jgi:phage-related protein
VLDWEAQECMSLDGGTLLNDKVDGDPQYLPPGDSVISWTGTVARLVVTPNWRYL